MKETRMSAEQSYHYLYSEISNGARLLGIDIDANNFATQTLLIFQTMSKFKLYEQMLVYAELPDNLRKYHVRESERIFAKCGLQRLSQIDPQKNPHILFAFQGVPDDIVSPYMVQLCHLLGETKINGQPVMMANAVNIASLDFGEPEIITNPANEFFSFPIASYYTHIDMNALGVINSAQPTINTGMYEF